MINHAAYVYKVLQCKYHMALVGIFIIEGLIIFITPDIKLHLEQDHSSPMHHIISHNNLDLDRAFLLPTNFQPKVCFMPLNSKLGRVLSYK